ncbi:MAG: hypothetical protein GX375_09070 [Clostridiales bacterium]|nr:hypothetical protein [Clostridiales bacterium]
MRTIAISRSLIELKEPLDSLGYKVYFQDEITAPVDVFIYSSDSSHPSLYSATQMLSSLPILSPSVNSEYNGTLLIDGRGKSIDEIRYIIENRLYSPIF